MAISEKHDFGLFQNLEGPLKKLKIKIISKSPCDETLFHNFVETIMIFEKWMFGRYLFLIENV